MVVDKEGFRKPRKSVKRERKRAANKNGLGKEPSDGSDSYIESGAEECLGVEQSKGKGPGLSKKRERKKEGHFAIPIPGGKGL